MLVLQTPGAASPLVTQENSQLDGVFPVRHTGIQGVRPLGSQEREEGFGCSKEGEGQPGRNCRFSAHPHDSSGILQLPEPGVMEERSRSSASEGLSTQVCPHSFGRACVRVFA